MNVSSLALGTVFLAVGTVFVAQAKKADAPAARNYRFAGSMMMVAAVAFLVAFALSVFLPGPGE